MAFPYGIQTWGDGSGPNTPLSAARMTVIENGIALAGAAGLGAAPPGSPLDGMIWRTAVSSSVYWMFQYDSSQATYKWVFIGGPAWSNEVATAETRNNAAYGDLTTVGPSITLPRGGDYLISFGSKCQPPASAADILHVSPKRGAAATSDNDEAVAAWASSASTQNSAITRTILFTGMAASDVVKLQYKTAAAGNATFANRWLAVTPVRVI